MPRTPESSSIGGPIENIVVQTAIDLIRKYSEGMERIETDNRVKNTLSIVTIGGMLPFSVSAILIIFGFQDFAKFVMVAGFVYLVVGVILLIITYRKVVERDSDAPWSGGIERRRSTRIRSWRRRHRS